MHKRQRKRVIQRMRRPFEWLGIALGFLVLAHLPRRAMQAACDFGGAVMHFFDRRGRELALANLRIIFGRDVPGAKKIVRRSYRNMARSPSPRISDAGRYSRSLHILRGIA